MLHRLLLPVACAIALPLTASAQTAALQSPLTGVTLPSGAKLDKGFLIRPAAKATMDMTAKDAGHSLGDKFEVYKLPLSADAQFAAQFSAIVDVVPTFRSLTVHYDPLQTDGERLGEAVVATQRHFGK